MKEFPYAQQIIWENDVEQIEWVEGDDYVWTGGTCLAKLSKNKSFIVGYWYYSKRSKSKFFFHNNFAIYKHEILCWAKL